MAPAVTLMGKRQSVSHPESSIKDGTPAIMEMIREPWPWPYRRCPSTLSAYRGAGAKAIRVNIPDRNIRQYIHTDTIKRVRATLLMLLITHNERASHPSSVQARSKLARPPGAQA